MFGIVVAFVGVVLLVYGLMLVFGFIKTDVSQDLDVDRKLISGKNRYRLKRYNSGIQFVVVGIGALILGIGLFLS